MRTKTHLWPQVVLTVLLSLFAVGCHAEHKSRMSDEGTPRTFSSGGYTWNLGAMKVNGTNVPLSAVEVKPAKD